MLERSLEKLGELHWAYWKEILILSIVITVLLGIQVSKIQLDTDIYKEMPQSLPSIQAYNKDNDIFGGSESIILIFNINKTKNPNAAITSPQVIAALKQVHEQLKQVPQVREVRSIASIFPQVPVSQDQVDKALKLTGMDRLVDRTKSSTIVMVYTNVGNKDKAIQSLIKNLKKKLENVDYPPYLEYQITGTPPLRIEIFNILLHDSVYTLSVAAAMICLLVLAITRSIKKTILVMIPIFFGLIWTLGVMGLVGIKLTVATVGIGAMILGLGVEYGIFTVSRYYEEHKHLGAKLAVKKMLSSVGLSITGSGTTTIAGFLALLLSTMPVMRELGLTLALGIANMLMVTLFVSPSIIIALERHNHV